MREQYKTNNKFLRLHALFLNLFLLISSFNLYAEEVCLGILAGSKSILSNEAKEVINAVNLASTEVNKNKNNKHTFTIQEKDTSLQINKALQALDELTNSSNPCKYIIGPQSTNEVVKLAPVAKSKDTLLLTATARSDDISYLNNYVFRFRHNQKQESEILAAYIKKQIGKAPLNTIILDSYAGYAFARNFKASYDKIGGNFGFFEDLSIENPNYSQIINKLKKLNATNVLAVGLSVQVADLMLESARAGLKIRFFGTADNNNQIIIQRAGELSEGFAFPYSFDPESDPNSSSFYTDYKSSFGQEPGYAAANAFDAVMALSTCLERVGNEVGAVKSCLFYIRDFPGAGGPLTINRDGSAERKLFMKTIKNGKFEKLNQATLQFN